MKISVTLVGIVAIAMFIGCSGADPALDAANTKSLPDGLMLDKAPADTPPLHKARSEAKKGAPVAFTGYIGGRVEPFTEGRAIFLVADTTKALACAGDDHCKTPWDACCTPSDQIAANSATVQVVDESGQMLPIGLKGRNGLEPGASVTVVGTVREVNENVFIVDATGLAVQDSTQG